MDNTIVQSWDGPNKVQIRLAISTVKPLLPPDWVRLQAVIEELTRFEAELGYEKPEDPF